MLGDVVSVIVDGGTSPGGEASTIVDVTVPEGRVLRLGALSLDAAQRRDRGARRRADGRGLTVREYLLVFLVALSVTYLLTVVAREIALRTGAVAAVRDRDVHAEPIPYLGGLAMLGGLVAAYLVARSCPSSPQRRVRLPRRRRRAARGRPDLRGRGARRPLRARRAHQARRPGAGRRPADLAGRAVLLFPGTTAPVLAGATARARSSPCSWSSAPSTR